jgi:NADPH:quinone reductase-like Zn-dependent oxidoreductase
METMMAVRAHERGGPEVLRYEEAPRPFAGNGEVLVEVHAAAVTPGELSWTPAGAARTTRLGRR